MSGLDGYRGRSLEEIDTILEVFEYLEGQELEPELMRVFDMGMEAKERLKTDRVERARFENLTKRMSGFFHDWVHSDPMDTEGRERLFFEARVVKTAIDELMTLPAQADEIARSRNIDGDSE